MIFKLISFNLWFEPVMLHQRAEYVASIIKIHNPDVVCLQEVTSESYRILQSHLPKYTSFPDKIQDDYFTMIMTSQTIQEQAQLDLPSTQQRDFKYIALEVDGIPINVGVIHLESHYISNEYKLEQFNMVLDYFVTRENAIIAGDTNIIDMHERYFSLPEPWKDVWQELGNEERWQYSYDSQNNKYAESPFRSRLDRIYYHGWDIFPISFKLIGTKEKNGVLPSDHFGMLAQFSYEN